MNTHLLNSVGYFHPYLHHKNASNNRPTEIRPFERFSFPVSLYNINPADVGGVIVTPSSQSCDIIYIYNHGRNTLLYYSGVPVIFLSRSRLLTIVCLYKYTIGKLCYNLFNNYYNNKTSVRHDIIKASVVKVSTGTDIQRVHV